MTTETALRAYLFPPRNFQKELAIQGRGAHNQTILRVYFTIVGGRSRWY
jgi:hypothetical protein